MTETQAKAATAEASDAPAKKPGAASDASAKPATEATGGDTPTPETDGAAGRASVVGRATVPGDGSAPAADAAAKPGQPAADDAKAGGGDKPKYTRAPGMAPPPDRIPAQPVSGAPAGADAAPTSAPPASGSAPTASVSGAGAGATAAVARASVKVPTGGYPTVGTSAASATDATTALPTGAARDGLATQPIAAGTARVAEAVRQARATVTGAGSRGPRRARLHLKRVDPWSVMKFSFAVSLVLFVVAIVATSVLYLALDTMGVFNSVNKALSDLFSANGGEVKDGFKITAKGVIGGSALLGAVNVVLFTALATLGSFIYNVCADLVGGIELTLSEKD